jgi:osmoprotectant transport system permease protein
MNSALHWPAWLAQLERLPTYLSGHIFLTVVALAAGIAASIPLSLWVIDRPRLRAMVLATAGVIQTIPSLALLALMVPLLGGMIGRVPAVLALFLYSMLPILRNAVTGILNVDPPVIEAARGIGMTPRQVMWKVQVPLALPVIIAGIRTATVWVVGMATLSTPVGATSLGNYIFSGLQTRNWVAVYVGCLAAAGLAILLDQLIYLVEHAFQTRSRRWGIVATIGLLGVFGSGLWPLTNEVFRRDNRPRVIVGAKSFTEQYILARLMAGQLREAGLRAETLESLGSTVAFEALAAGTIDVYVDYSGTIWTNYMQRSDSPGRSALMREMTDWLAHEHQVTVLGALGFENTYALAIRDEDARRQNIRTIADLVPRSAEWILGGDYELFSRPEWARVQQDYGLQFRDLRSFDPTLMYQAVRDKQVGAIVAFSTDGRLIAYDLRVLDDPLESFPPYDAVILLSPKAARDPRILEALQPLVESVPDERMRRANMIVDVERNSVDAAVQFLRSFLP